MSENTITSNTLRTDDFDYDLDKKFIAQRPVFPRHNSKLMMINRATGEISHHIFHELPQLLSKDDVLVFNNSKVFPARVFGKKKIVADNISVITGLSNYSQQTSKTVFEILFLKHIKKGNWECLLKPAKRMKTGDKIILSDGHEVELLKKNEDGTCIVSVGEELNVWYQILEKIGEMPLPPYITEKIQDNSEYQTTYAKENGSAAAPTAGLHFTDLVFDKLRKQEIRQEYVTLHVGLDTFQPVRVDNIRDHKMHTEYYEIDEKTRQRLTKHKNEGKRIVAVGTTSVRVLESYGASDCKIASGNTDIFIYPGYKYTFVDAIITNFHLPKSTLIMMISAFTGKDLIMKAYNEAMQNNYRFYSFGDAMLIL